jgi:hypothetical protein
MPDPEKYRLMKPAVVHIIQTASDLNIKLSTQRLKRLITIMERLSNRKHNAKMKYTRRERRN